MHTSRPRNRIAAAAGAWDDTAARLTPDREPVPILTDAEAAASDSMRLSDGRRLAFAQFGRASGHPVVLFHGMPASRLERHPDDSIAHRLRIRLITVDRPGYGRSDYQGGRRLIDWPTDVAELANWLGLDRFGLIGVSGGGPYAIACAAALPERVRALALVSSLAPLTVGPGVRTLSRSTRFTFRVARIAPWLARWPLAFMARAVREDPERFITELAATLPEPDRALLSEPESRAAYRRDVAEAFRQGARGYVRDMHVLARAWGVDLGRVRLPVHLWHGDVDQIVPIAMARYLAGQLPNCQTTYIPGGGHLLLHRCWEDVLPAAAGARLA